MTVGDILRHLNAAAPFKTAESFDNVGLLTGSEDREVTRVLCCLDITRAVVSEAAEMGAELIVSHHPVIFGGLKNIPEHSPIVLLIKNNISVIAMHTNFDIAEGGVNDTLIETLGFKKLETLEVTQADGKGFGAVCELEKELSAREVVGRCKEALGLRIVRCSAGLGEKRISRVAVCCGAGIDENVMRLAAEKGCGAIISGDIKHNFWIEAQDRRIVLIDAGHYGTEIAAKNVLAKLISEKFADVEVIVSKAEKDPAEYSV